MNPLATTQSILAAVKSDPKLAYDQTLKDKYLSLGGALTNNGIPTQDITTIGKVDTASPLGVGSSEKGLELLQKAQATEQKLTPITPPAQTTTPTQTTTTKAPVSSTKVTLINPNTEQEVTFDDAALNRDNITAYLSSGYQLGSASGAIPSWMTPNANGTVAPKSDLQLQYEKDAAQAETDIAKLRNFSAEMDKDPALKSLLESVATQWDLRIKEGEQTATSQNAAITTAGYRTGLQYAGGNAGSTKSIISAQERAGIDMVSKLIAQKNTALAEARSAYESKEWDRYATLVNVSEKKLAESKKAIADLNTKMIEENQKRQENARLGSLSTAVAGVMRQGVTDPKEIIDIINSYEDGSSTGANLTAKELKEMTDLFGLDENKDIAQVIKDAAKNGATPETIDAISKAQNLAEAVKAAGGFLQDVTTSGIVGEYLYYKKDAEARGVVPLNFDAYQTRDANRKARAAGTGQDINRVLSATEAQLLGVPFGTTAGQAYGKTVTKPATEAQNKDAGYAQRSLEANSILNGLESSVSGMNSLSFTSQASLETSTVGNTLVSDEFRQMRQAERNFVNAILRRESGAAISPSEFVSAEKQYFARPGDDATTLKNKAQARETVIKNLAQSAGPALAQTVGVPSIAEEQAAEEQAAEQAVSSWAEKNPTSPYADTVLTLEQQGKPYSEIVSYLTYNGIKVK